MLASSSLRIRISFAHRHLGRPGSVQDAEHERSRDEAGSVRALELRQQVPHMVGDRLVRDVERSRRGLGRLALGELREYLCLPLGKREDQAPAGSAEMLELRLAETIARSV